jgi:hypothetical protein
VIDDSPSTAPTVNIEYFILCSKDADQFRHLLQTPGSGDLLERITEIEAPGFHLNGLSVA